MKILVLASRFPYPIEKGDKLRLFHQIREISKQHEVILCALSDIDVPPEARSEMARYCKEMYIFPLRKWRIWLRLLAASFSGRSLSVAYFLEAGIQKKIRRVIEKVQPDHVYCQLIRMAGYASSLEVPATLDYMDTFSIGMHRRAQKAPAYLRPFLRIEAQRLARWEQKVFSWFQHHTIISRQDREALNIAERDCIRIIPNGVDTVFFRRKPQSQAEFELVFVGNMGYHPNIVAARFLVESIMPLVWQKHPKVRLLLAGARPSREVLSLTSERVVVSGWVEDIRDAYQNGQIFVAPLFSGSGQQNKILEAMAMGVPCITTSLVNNAIGAVESQQVLLADTAEGFSHQIDRLLADHDLSAMIASEGRQFVQATYSWAQSTQKLMNAWEATS